MIFLVKRVLISSYINRFPNFETLIWWLRRGLTNETVTLKELWKVKDGVLTIKKKWRELTNVFRDQRRIHSVPRRHYFLFSSYPFMQSMCLVAFKYEFTGKLMKQTVLFFAYPFLIFSYCDNCLVVKMKYVFYHFIKFFSFIL